MTRRTFFKAAGLGTAVWMGQNIEQDAKAVKIVGYVLADADIRNIVFPPSLKRVSEQNPSYYDERSLTQTRILTFGDSIARGEVDGAADAAPAGFIVEKMNNFLGTNNWNWKNEAWNGATTQDVLSQIKNVQRNETDIPSDALLSVGGNDMLAFIETPETIEQLEALLSDPSNMQLLQVFARRINRFLTEYKDSVAEVITAFNTLPQKGISLQRLYVHGMPHMGNAKNIVLPNGTKLPLKGAIGTLANNVSKLINHTTSTAIQEAAHADFHILYVDNAHLQSEDFSDMHPNKKGYERMADAQLKQGAVLFPSGPKTLFDLAA